MGGLDQIILAIKRAQEGALPQPTAEIDVIVGQGYHRHLTQVPELP
jgi:hypothetical protein